MSTAMQFIVPIVIFVLIISRLFKKASRDAKTEQEKSESTSRQVRTALDIPHRTKFEDPYNFEEVINSDDLHSNEIPKRDKMRITQQINNINGVVKVITPNAIPLKPNTPLVSTNVANAYTCNDKQNQITIEDENNYASKINASNIDFRKAIIYSEILTPKF